jgi:hypothetical protein
VVAVGGEEKTEEQEEEQQQEEVEQKGSVPAVRMEGFASILQQLDPNRLKKSDVVVQIPTKPLKRAASAPPSQQEGDDDEEEAAGGRMDVQTDPSIPPAAAAAVPEAVDLSNQYSLEDNSSPEVFVPVSVQQSVQTWGVDPQLAQTLLRDGVTSFFPVQTAVLPLLLQSAQTPFLQPRDICVSAPTGSGKTLSYALPIIQTLRPRVVTRLRALVLLPSRELAAQVRVVLCCVLCCVCP